MRRTIGLRASVGLVGHALVMLAMVVGCEKEGQVVDRVTREPVPGAQVTMRSRVSQFPNPPMGRAVGVATDGEGRYRFEKVEGDFEFLSAWAPSYYPNADYDKDSEGIVALTPVPKDALPIRKGRITADAEGPAMGFCFHTGAPAPPEESDIILTSVGSPVSGALRVQATGDGGIMPFIGPASPERSFEFHQVLEAPEAGYQAAVEISAKTRFLFVRCREGYHYARVYLGDRTMNSAGQIEVFFGYCVQPDGSRYLPPRPIFATDLDLARCGVPGSGEPK